MILSAAGSDPSIEDPWSAANVAVSPTREMPRPSGNRQSSRERDEGGVGFEPADGRTVGVGSTNSDRIGGLAAELGGAPQARRTWVR
jgi:hypothetical protein